MRGSLSVGPPTRFEASGLGETGKSHDGAFQFVARIGIGMADLLGKA